MSDRNSFFKTAFLTWYPRGATVVALRAGLLFAVMLGLLTLASRVSYQGQPDDNPSAALAGQLERQGHLVDAASIHWIDGPRRSHLGDLRPQRAIFLAKSPGEPLRDFFIARVRLTSAGKVAAARLWNLTRTPSCAEQGLWARGGIAAVACQADEGYINVSFFDFTGESPKLTAAWPAVERLKNRLTNLQKTGQRQGVGAAFMELRPPQPRLDVKIAGQGFVVDLGGTAVTVRSADQGFSLAPADPAGGPGGGRDLVDFQPAEKAISGHVAWTVDTARTAPLIGKEKIGWAEKKWYRLDDFFKRLFYAVAGSRYTVNAIKDDLGVVGQGGAAAKAFAAQEAGIDLKAFQPPDVKLLPGMEAIETEGKWQPLMDEAFNLRDPHAPPSLYRTFVRADPERPFATANLVAWDPRMVEIHVVAGVVEPKCETGRAGTGAIPRDDETMQRLLAGFNGGFQALHGEFGLMQEGKVYLPPKPWAATVALLRGGRTGFGTWPGPESGEIPAEIFSYRQNLTPLMMDGKINPYKRHWWGSSPDLNPDSPMIARSGICWTESNHVIYALAYSVSEVSFAETMKRAGCHYLIQLDVNAGHSGFEFYRVTPSGAAPALNRSLDSSWEQQGPVKERDDLLFRAQKLFKKMSIMRFPRFIAKEPRDFFYITLARNLPGPPLPAGEMETTGWSTGGIPGNHFPPAFAAATAHLGERRNVRIVRVDPRWVSVAPLDAGVAAAGQDGGALMLPAGIKIHVSGRPDWSLAEGREAVIWGYDALADEWSVLVAPWSADFLTRFKSVIALELPADADTDADAGAGDSGAPFCGALGIGPHRFFAWAEGDGVDFAALKKILLLSGAERVIKIPAPAAPAGGGWSFVSAEESGGKVRLMPLIEGKPGAPGQAGLLFAPAADRAAAVRLFPDTQVVEPKVWNPPQVKRIRYFKLAPIEEGQAPPAPGAP